MTPIDSNPETKPSETRMGTTSTLTPDRPQPLGTSPVRLPPQVQRYLAPLARFGNRNLAYAGAVLVFLGVWLPIKALSIPFADITVTANFWDVSKFESLILILAAAASAGLGYIRDYRWLWATAGVILLFEIIQFFDALTATYIHPSWGWVVLLAGVLLLFAAAALDRDPREKQGDARVAIEEIRRRFAAPR